MSLSELIPAEKALEIVLSSAAPARVETVALVDAFNLILAEDLASLRTQPPFDASAMDGYAVRSEDIATIPAFLKIAGEAKAGTPHDAMLQSGEAVRIFTGGVVPQGCDTIIIQENAIAHDGQVEILKGNPAGKFIRPAGLDFKKGDILVKTGDRLSANRLALAASMNHAEVKVFSRPKVAMIATGDELVMPGNNTEPGQIIASNTFGIQACAQSAGAQVLDFGIAKDNETALSGALSKAIDEDVDLIVTTGGASVGDHDLVLPVAKKLGFEFKITKIAMRPGKPFLFATLTRNDHCIYLTGLAGNPVSSLIAFNVFVKPLINRLCGRADEVVTPLPAILGCDLAQNDERMEYMRASLAVNSDGVRVATPFSKQDSSMLANLVRADCLVLRPENAKASPKGEACKIIMLD